MQNRILISSAEMRNIRVRQHHPNDDRGLADDNCQIDVYEWILIYLPGQVREVF